MAGVTPCAIDSGDDAEDLVGCRHRRVSFACYPAIEQISETIARWEFATICSSRMFDGDVLLWSFYCW